MEDEDAVSASGQAAPTRRSTRAVTLEDVSRLAGVSPSTVSRVIRDPSLVAEQTVKRVLAAVRSTGYVPNLAASHLASNRSKTVAAIIPSISASIFADAVHALNDVFSNAGYQVFIGSTDYRVDAEERLIRAFIGRRPDGFFIVGTEHTPTTRELLRAAKVPVVEAFELTDDPIDTVVGFSNERAAEAIVEHVVSRGYRHPTFAGSITSDDARAASRERGFETAMRRLLPDEPVRTVTPRTAALDMETGRVLLERVYRLHPETDVIVFSSDIFAAGALLECIRAGTNVPGDLAITGFGDFEIAKHLVPRLTTVATPNVETGRHAAELLLAALNGTPAGPTSVDLGFSVVARESA